LKAISELSLIYVLGCGRFFEGKPEEMHVALNKTLASLPDETVVYVRFLKLRPEQTVDEYSLAMNTQKQMSNLAFLFYRAKLLRN